MSEDRNVFEHSQAETIKESVKFPDVCGERVTLGGMALHCRKTHMYGDTEHELLVKDDSGRVTLRLTWN